MKRIIASTEMHTYRRYFKDVNQKLFDALRFSLLIRYNLDVLTVVHHIDDIYKVEEVE